MSAARKVRVLHVAETVKGGVSSYLEELVPLQLAEFGPDAVRLVIPAHPAPDLRDVPPALLHRYPNGRRRLRNAGTLARVLAGPFVRQFAPTVVHAHSSFAGAAVRLYYAGRRPRPRIVYSPHAWSFFMDVGALERRVYVLAERLLGPLADDIVCVSRHEYDQAASLGVGGDRLRLVVSGIADLPHPTPAPVALPVDWPPGRKRVLFVGRFDHQKGIDRVDRIMRRLGDAAFGVVVGEPVGADASPPRFGDNVAVVGWQPRPVVAALLARTDLVLIPSRWEGLTIVGLEALRAGKAIFATDVGGMAEIVTPANGVLVPEPAAERLADAIRATGPAELAAMGRRSRELFLERFRVERVHRELAAIYRGDGSRACAG
ncbi:MAG TPA: glycosyltransferase [Gemmatimonadales bacterium]|nr:glycosyltransferase [Gemmatimonadales bacterium]